MHIILGARHAAALLALAIGSAAFGQAGEPEDAGAPPANAAVSPDVNLTPRRVVFEGDQRGVKEVIVFNRAAGTAVYSVGLVERIMTPEGNLVDPEQASPEARARLKSASSWLRYSPRQVTLGPNESQTVRIQARRPADLPPGEYRAHFTVSATPPQDAGLDVATAAGAADNNQIAIRLTPVYGISIPVIVRTGDLAVQAQIEGLRVAQVGGSKAAQFTVTRSGDRSLYGAFQVALVNGGDAKQIAEIRGVGVYPEIESRDITIPLPDDVALPAGSRLRVSYIDDDAKPGAVLAQAEVAVP